MNCIYCNNELQNNSVQSIILECNICNCIFEDYFDKQTFYLRLFTDNNKYWANYGVCFIRNNQFCWRLIFSGTYIDFENADFDLITPNNLKAFINKISKFKAFL